MTYVLGITGGIATGKSTASRFFEKQGASIIDADKVAREVVESGTPAFEKIRQCFGSVVIQEDGTLNRKKLGEVIFSDANKRKMLDAIVQKEIRSNIMSQINEEKQKTYPLVVVEIPLLYEERYETMLDGVLVVTTTRESQKKRLMKRNGFTEEAAEQRIDAQWSLDEKERKADWVIHNTDSFLVLEERLQSALDKCKSDSQK